MSSYRKNELSSERVLRYLENAEKARAQAEASTDPKMRDAYLQIAASWERMAERHDWFENLGGSALDEAEGKDPKSE